MHIINAIAPYQECLHEDFTVVRAGGDPITLRLAEVEEQINSPIQLAFTLLFTGPPEPLPQALYQLTHERLGSQHLCLVPVGRSATGMRYEAAFNLLRESPRDNLQSQIK